MDAGKYTVMHRAASAGMIGYMSIVSSLRYPVLDQLNLAFFFFFLFFLGPYLLHMEIPRLGVEQKLQLPVYATAMAILDPSHIDDLCCSLWQHRILSPRSNARDGTCILTDTTSGS